MQFALSIFPRVDLKKWFWIYFSRMDYRFILFERHSDYHFVKIFLGFQDFFFSLYSTKNTLSSAYSILVWIDHFMPKQYEMVPQPKNAYKTICAYMQKISLHLWSLWYSILWPQNCFLFLTKSMGMKQNKVDQCLSEGLA